MSITIQDNDYYYILLEELVNEQHKQQTELFKERLDYKPIKGQPLNLLHYAIIEYAIKNYPEAITAANQRVLDNTPEVVRSLTAILSKQDGEN